MNNFRIGLGMVNRKVMRTMIGSSDIICDVPDYVILHKAGRLNLDDLVSGHYPLEQINEAVE